MYRPKLLCANLWESFSHLSLDKLEYVKEPYIKAQIITKSDFIGPVTHSNITEGIFSFAMSGSAIDGGIYTISFTGKSAGQSSITLGKVHLIQNDGSNISNFNSFSLPDPVIITVSENE